MRATWHRFFFSILAGPIFFSLLPNTLHAQIQLNDPVSTDSSIDETRSIVESPAGESKTSESAALGSATNDGYETEKISDRHPDGKVALERTVTLDKDGNFTNHGEYREFSRSGEIIASGSFHLGQPTGVWFKLSQANDAKLFSSYPFTKFRAPFTSTASFADGKLNGVWTIADKDNKVVCQIELQGGLRNGLATFYHPNGQIQTQAEYVNGELNGRYVEKSLDGKNVRDDLYQSGQRVEEVTEYYANKKVKSVTNYLSAPLKVEALDDWSKSTLASYAPNGGRQLHGGFTTYHDNGQIAARGHYDHGVLNGKFESFHRNAEVAATGTYEKGLQTGAWVWRHSNGMKSAVATYVEGELESMPLAWDESGKAIRPAMENSDGPVANTAKRYVAPASSNILR